TNHCRRFVHRLPHLRVKNFQVCFRKPGKRRVRKMISGHSTWTSTTYPENAPIRLPAARPIPVDPPLSMPAKAPKMAHPGTKISNASANFNDCHTGVSLFHVKP